MQSDKAEKGLAVFVCGEMRSSAENVCGMPKAIFQNQMVGGCIARRKSFFSIFRSVKMKRTEMIPLNPQNIRFL